MSREQRGAIALLLGTRPDTFPDYHEEAFVEAFRPHFDIERVTRLPGNDRALYLLRGAPQ